jgi:hypothetical protein
MTTAPAFATAMEDMVGRSYEAVEIWMRDAETQAHMRAWLDERGLSVAPRIALAMVLLAGGHVITDAPHDGIMQREAQRFVRTACAAMRDPAAPLPDVDRMRRFYAAWKAEDREHLLTHLVSLAHSTRGADESVFEAIAQLGGPADVVRASLSWARVGAADLPEHVAAIARRAFWDVVRDGVARGDYAGFFDVLDEMRSGMLALVAHHGRTVDDLKDKLDVAWLRQRHAHGALDAGDVGNLVAYLATAIAGWQAPADVDPAWAPGVRTRLRDATTPTVVVDLLAEAHEKLGGIYVRLMALAPREEA